MARSVPAVNAIHEPRPLSYALKSATCQSKTASRRSIFSLLSTFRDLPSLISNSSAHQRGDITDKAFFSGYADDPNSDTQNSRPARPSPAMLSSKDKDDRPSSRKLKSGPGDRLYNFLTRSRSRSRSKNEPPAPLPSSSTMPSLAPTPRKTNPASKPASRIPSRPLSSTTSTTITPSATPKPKKPTAPAAAAAADKTPRPPTTKTQREPAARPSTAPASVSQPSTPKASGARQVLHDLFGIPLGRKASSRSCSRSRPPSPAAAVGHSLDAPPLPADDDTTPRPHRSTAAADRPRSRSISPTPQTRVLRVTNDSSTGSQGTTTTAASVKIKLFGGGSTKSRSNTPPGTHPASSSKRTSRSSTTNAAPAYAGFGTPVLPPLPSVSSIPSIGGIVSPVQHNGAATLGSSNSGSRIVPPSQAHKRSASAVDARPSPPPLPHSLAPGPPQSMAQASKNNTVPGASKPTPGSSGSTQRYRHAAKGSLDASYRYRNGGPAMSRLTEESSSARGSVVSGGGGGGETAATAPPGLAPLVLHSSNSTHVGNTKMSSRAPSGSGGHGGGVLIVPADVGQPLPSPVARAGSRMSSHMRATKHGSFDFERPGWGGAAPAVGAMATAAMAMRRSESGGTTGTESSGVRERDSVYGPGLAGVGTLQRETSMRRAQEREEAVRLKDKARKMGLEGYVDKGKERARDKDRERERDRDKEMRTKEKETPSTSQRTTPQQDSLHAPSETLHASTSTGRSAPTPVAGGKTSSMSRAPPAAGANKRSLLPKRGSSVKRLVGLGANQLGAFSFEPAVPSPTRSNTSSVATAHEVALPPGFPAKAERERERLSQEKERQLQLSKTRSRDRDRAPVPVPIPPPAYGDMSPTTANGFIPLGNHPATTTTTTTANANGYAASAGGGNGSWGRASSKKVTSLNAGHRSGVKGRSLDLGLGLAWAPSKVREEALLPSSGFFARTASGTSGSSGQGAAPRTASGTSSSGGANGGAVRNVRDVERSKAGKEVAEIFRSALDPHGYAMFKSYVHKFDAHEIPFDGPTGIVTLVEDLLAVRSHLDGDKKQRLVDKFIRILLSQA